MKTAEKSALTKINKIEIFHRSMKKLTVNEEMTDVEASFLLSAALVFAKHYEADKRLSSYAELAYYIILKYAIISADYRPLFDFSVNFGFYPIAKAILENALLSSSNIQDCFSEIKMDPYVNNERNFTETYEQKQIHDSILNDAAQEISYIAPTSYGKSSIIVDHIRARRERNRKIGIIVPTKSLLMQTYRMIRDAELGMKILIHDEMYNAEDAFVAIFTQERALRLLISGRVRFDILYIDEAHNIFDDDQRSILLSRLISKNMVLNPRQKVVYLSPLVSSSSNLRISASQEIVEKKIHFNVKEPEIYEFCLNGNVRQYNRFVNDFYHTGTARNERSYIARNAQMKNFIYIRAPRKIEEFARELSAELALPTLSPALEELIDTLKRNVHEDFKAIESVKKGVIYLHGKLPDLVKEYLESKFLQLPEIRYLIANTVVLEGMNLPIDTLFILNTYDLNNKALTNLIGRVNRLNQIFTHSTNQLHRLLPKIHFVNSKVYNRSDSNMQSKICSLRSRIFDDEIANPTLSSFDFDALKIDSKRRDAKKKYYENIAENENFIKQSASNDLEALKKYLVESAIHAVYSKLDDATVYLHERIQHVRAAQDDWSSKRMLDKISFLFFDEALDIADFELERLQDIKTRNFYELHISNSHRNSLKQNVTNMYEYFTRKIESNESLFYMGDSYGEISRPSEVYTGRERPVYVDLSTKTKADLINLAIVKLKMENDFVSFKLNKFITMMYDYNLISDDEYNLYIYGTTNQRKITFTKFGLSGSLISRLESDKQLENISLDEFNNLIGNKLFHDFKSTVDDFYRFEIERFI